MQATPGEKLQEYVFPKKVGIIFLERRKGVVQERVPRTVYEDILLWNKERDELSLDFDQDACAFLLLHLNHYQKIFEFQVVHIPIPEEERIPPRTRIRNLLRRMIGKSPKENDKESSKEKDKESPIPKKSDKECLFSWLDIFALKNSNLSISYWMGITNEQIPIRKKEGKQIRRRHFDKRKPKYTMSGRILWIISSLNWEKYRSPPSLFEYLLASVFRCAIESLSRELEDDELKKEKFLRHFEHSDVTRGCMFDFTHRRSSVSIFKLCFGCEEKLRKLEDLIRKNGNNWYINLVDDVNTILSKEWMGTPEKRDSPLFDLKKMYKYDVDRNSGFNKGLLEKFRDNISDNLAQWTVGAIVGGIGTIIGTIVLTLFFKH